MKKDILIIAGPSAVGKSTIAALLVADGDFACVRSVTTRPKREDGFDAEYLYITEEEFSALSAANALAEHTVYAEAAYGTPISELTRIFGEGKQPLLILDTAGVRALCESAYKDRVYAVYLYDTLNTLDERLYQRELAAAPSVDALLRFVRRKERNTAEYRNFAETQALFDLFLENGEPAATAEAIRNAMRKGMRFSEEDRAKTVSLLFDMAKEKDTYMAEN